MHPVVLLAVVVAAAQSAGAASAQTGDSIPFLPPEVHRADGTSILPHRLELEETTRYENDSTDVDSYTFVTVEHAQAWDELQLVIDWSALTWNGTGYDKNVVAADGLALRGRITPSWIPFAYYVESHYFPEVSNLTQVDPDGEVRRYATFEERETGVHNEIVYPYLLSRLDLAEGARFVVPAFNPYRASAPFQYRLFVVRGRTEVRDDDGHAHAGWIVDAVSRDDTTSAREAADSFPEAFARYYVSADPPYFLGKEWIRWPDGTGRTVDKRWRLMRHDPLRVTAQDRMEDILRIRARRGADQVIPWQDRSGNR